MNLALCRIYNGEPYLKKYLDQMSLLVDKILLVDDGSTDETYKICKNWKKVEIERIKVNTQHDGLINNYLYNWADKFSPDWIISLDIDEVFKDSDVDNVATLIRTAPKRETTFSFPMLYLWDKEDQYRADGWFGTVKAMRLYHYVHGKPPMLRREHGVLCPEGWNEFMSKININLPILHYGYLDKETREYKYKYYKAKDNMEDYSHIISDKVTLKKVEEFK